MKVTLNNIGKTACWGILQALIVIVALNSFGAPKYFQYAITCLYFLLYFELELIRNKGWWVTKATKQEVGECESTK
jgi:hypothetical protein